MRPAYEYDINPLFANSRSSCSRNMSFTSRMILLFLVGPSLAWACVQDADCPAGQFCKNMNVGYSKSYCKTKESNGVRCIRDTMCASGKRT